MVSWNAGRLRLAAGTDMTPYTEEVALPVSIRRSEDILYMDIFSGEEAAL